MAYHLYTAGRKLVAAGNNQMVVAKQITEAGDKAVAVIDNIKVSLYEDVKLSKKELTKLTGDPNQRLIIPPKKVSNMLTRVAATSAGDEAIGELVADTISSIGADGGVTIEDFAGRGIYNEIVEGFYFRKGLVSAYLAKDPANLESKHFNVPILILDKQLSSQAEAHEIFEAIPPKFTEIVVIGSVTGDALAYLVQKRLSAKMLVSIVDPPYEARSFFLEDLALLTGATVITEGLNAYDFDADLLGFAAKVVINTVSTTLLGSDGEKENVDKRIADLQKQLKESSSPTDIEMIRKRLNWLTGKVAIIRVGGASEIEQKEVKLRVVDAVAASQAALKDGIVPGGGTTLARMNVGFTEAFEAPFKQLASNGGYNSEKLLALVQASPDNYGFNLRNVGDKPVDLIKAGIVDPALVIKEVITNAASVAAKLLTTSSGIVLASRDEKHD